MGLDARVRYTKQAIRSALTALLREKPLNKVTVKELCALAEINRATFYKYYSDPFDLLAQIEQESLSRLQRSLQAPPAGFRSVFARLLAEIRADGESYQTLFSENGDPQFPGRIFSLYYGHIAEDLRRQFPQLSAAQREWLYYYVAQGCCGVLTQWIRNGMREPPEAVSAFAERLLSRTVEQL